VTDRLTDKQMDKLIALSRCRERRLKKLLGWCIKIEVSLGGHVNKFTMNDLVDSIKN